MRGGAQQDAECLLALGKKQILRCLRMATLMAELIECHAYADETMRS
jgi:hypothetical protein